MLQGNVYIAETRYLVKAGLRNDVGCYAETRGFEYLKLTLARDLANLRRVSPRKELKLLEVCYFYFCFEQ